MADAFGPRPGVSVARFRRSGGVLLATPPYPLPPSPPNTPPKYRPIRHSHSAGVAPVSANERLQRWK